MDTQNERPLPDADPNADVYDPETSEPGDVDSSGAGAGDEPAADDSRDMQGEDPASGGS